MNLNELKKRFEETATAKRRKTEEIKLLRAELAETEKEMLDAADHGDLAAYKKLDEKKRDIEARIFVYTRSLPSAGNPLTREEVITSWDAFSKTYNRDAKKQYEAYIADCKALAAKYKKLTSMQSAAMKERESALQMIGEKRDSTTLTMYMIPFASSEKFMRWAKNCPDLAFFEDKGMFTREESEEIFGIVAY